MKEENDKKAKLPTSRRRQTRSSFNHQRSISPEIDSAVRHPASVILHFLPLR